MKTDQLSTIGSPTFLLDCSRLKQRLKMAGMYGCSSAASSDLKMAESSWHAYWSVALDDSSFWKTPRTPSMRRSTVALPCAHGSRHHTRRARTRRCHMAFMGIGSM